MAVAGGGELPPVPRIGRRRSRRRRDSRSGGSRPRRWLGQPKEAIDRQHHANAPPPDRDARGVAGLGAVPHRRLGADRHDRGVPCEPSHLRPFSRARAAKSSRATMFLTGTILRQIAHPPPALTRPTRRSDLENPDFRRAMPRYQSCPQASQGRPASCSAAAGLIGRPDRRLPTRTRLATRTLLPTTTRLATRTRLATTTRRAASAAPGPRTRPPMRAWTEPGRPVRGRRDGQGPALARAQGSAPARQRHRRGPGHRALARRHRRGPARRRGRSRWPGS